MGKFNIDTIFLMCYIVSDYFQVGLRHLDARF